MSWNDKKLEEMLKQNIEDATSDCPNTRIESVAMMKEILRKKREEEAAKSLEAKTRKYNFVSKLCFAVLIFFIGFIAGIVSMKFINSPEMFIYESDAPKDVKKYKDHIDTCISFGSVQTLDVLYKAGIISQMGHDTLSQEYKDNSQFIVYYGTKDNTDQIVLIDVNKKIHTVSPGFPYTANELLDYCSSLINSEFDDLYLNKEQTGLYMQIGYYCDGTSEFASFHVSHQFMYDNQQYVVYYKDQAFKSYQL